MRPKPDEADVADYILDCHNGDAKAAVQAMQDEIEHLQHQLNIAVAAMGRVTREVGFRAGSTTARRGRSSEKHPLVLLRCSTLPPSIWFKVLIQLGVKMRAFKVAAICMLVAGCVQVNKELVATGGSRADGTVDLSYEQSSVETVKLDPNKGLVTARERCVAWGYKDASPFGGETRQCQVSNQYGCGQWLATIRYQCLGETNQSKPI